MTFIIETGIPIPPPGRSTGISAALRSLELGQSTVIPEKSFPSISAYLKKSFGLKFSRRSVGDGKLRVWRIE